MINKDLMENLGKLISCMDSFQQDNGGIAWMAAIFAIIVGTIKICTM